MKNLMKLFAVLLLTTIVFSACSKDDDPANDDLFVGTYKGTISYVAADKNISTDDGTVRVIKVGNNYNFIFSDGIPDLTGVEFKKDANTVISIGSDETKFIKITESTLNIGFLKDGATWTANCSR